MKKSVVIFLAAFSFALAVQSINAQTIAQWTFETNGLGGVSTSGLTLAPGANTSPGTALADNGMNASSSTASGLHVGASTYTAANAGDLDPTIAGFASGATGPGNPGSGAANASPSFHTLSANNWAVGDYWSFTTSTLGFSSVTVAFDEAGSATGPANFGLQYSINGGAFTSFGTYSVVLSTWNTTTADPSSVSFSGGGAFDNATSITFRLVDLNTTSINGGTVATGGTDRFDNFTVASVVPEPTALALAGLGGLSLLLFRRQRK